MAQATPSSSTSVPAPHLLDALRQIDDALIWLIDIADDTSAGGLTQLPGHSVVAILRGMQRCSGEALP